MALWLPSYRAFKKAIGEMTAAAAGIHVSVRVASKVAVGMTGIDPWSQLAQEVGIRMDGVDQLRINRTASNLGLVATYSAFDTFIRELRRDWYDLTKIQWQQFDGDALLQGLRRNAPTHFDLGSNEALIEYYRKCRNWIVHPVEPTLAEAKSYFQQESKSLSEARDTWRPIVVHSAPHEPDKLEFEDSKLFARVALHVGEIISNSFDPGDKAISLTLPISNWSRLAHDPIRLRGRASGFLQTEWGLERTRADQIAAMAIPTT